MKNGSQFGEDVFLFSLFDKNYKGIYLDVGCYHPTKHNNTFIFFKNGWHGINIDLNPLTIELFNFMRPNDINLNIGVSSEELEKNLYFIDETNTQNTLSENQLIFLKKHHNLQPSEITQKKEHNQKNITQVYQKMLKIKEQITLKKISTKKVIPTINLHQVIKMPRLNHQSILKSLNKCMVK